MRIVIVRHGDPNYELDTLTPTGWEEAELVSERVTKFDVKNFYLSPKGRAQDTASLTLKKMGRTGETMEWLKEFDTLINRPDCPDRKNICWDWTPGDWTSRPAFFDAEHWYDEPEMEAGGIKEAYLHVCEEFDALLAKHGYVRDGLTYRVEERNDDTIVFFCHFGLECVLISHLLHVSPMILWHGFFAAPTSVTTIYTEERREGVACFRVAAFGDISHLYVKEKEPSTCGRFCECFGNGDRVD